MNNNFIEDTCELIDKIKDVLDEHKVTTLTSYKLKDIFYLITDFMIITYSENNHMIDISFHIATRPDISAFFILLLKDFDEIKYINVMESYMKDEKGQILTGDECIEKHQKNVKDIIIDNFVKEQLQLHYLQTCRMGGVC